MSEVLEYCPECNHPLEPCGPQGLDGEPTMDCVVCKLRKQLAAERLTVKRLLDIIANKDEEYRIP